MQPVRARIAKLACRACCIIFVASGIWSCSPKVVTAQRDTVTQVRTQYVERWRDTTIYVQLPRDSVRIATFDTTSVLHIKTAISEAVVANGVLHHSLYSDASYVPMVTASVADTETVRDSLVYVEVVTPVEVERELTKVQKFRMGCGDAFICLMLALAGLLVWRLLHR